MSYTTDTAAPAPSDGPAEEQVAEPATDSTIDLDDFDEEDRAIIEEFDRQMASPASDDVPDGRDDTSEETSDEYDFDELRALEVPDLEPMGSVEEAAEFDRQHGRGHLWPDEPEADDGEARPAAGPTDPDENLTPSTELEPAFARDVPRFDENDAAPADSVAAEADEPRLERPLPDCITIDATPAGGKSWLIRALLASDDFGGPTRLYHDEINPDKAKDRQLAAAYIAEAVGEPPVGEVADALAEKILDAVDETDAALDAADDSDGPTKNDADRVVGAVEDALTEVFRTPSDVPHVTTRVKTGLDSPAERLQTMRANEEEFRLLVRRATYEKFGQGVSDAALASTVGLFEAKAMFGPDVHPVWTRTAWCCWGGEEAVAFATATRPASARSSPPTGSTRPYRPPTPTCDSYGPESACRRSGRRSAAPSARSAITGISPPKG